MDGSFACQARKSREEASISINALHRTAIELSTGVKGYRDDR
jgi:hypothetical protein